MALKIYGIARSRAFRTLWMAKELGLDYENVEIDFATGETRAPEYLAINPNGHVPAIDDDGFMLWESMAINLYLAKKHGKRQPLSDPLRGRGAGLAMELLGDDRGRAAGADRDVQPRAFARGQARCGAGRRMPRRRSAGRLMVLDRRSPARPTCSASTSPSPTSTSPASSSWARPARIDMSRVPKAADWLKRCAERPAARRRASCSARRIVARAAGHRRRLLGAPRHYRDGALGMSLE